MQIMNISKSVLLMKKLQPWIHKADFIHLLLSFTEPTRFNEKINEKPKMYIKSILTLIFKMFSLLSNSI
jgi:hypothetical protein